MKSYLAYDQQIKGKRPGVLVVPEVWGLNGYARKRTRMLAELGYTARFFHHSVLIFVFFGSLGYSSAHSTAYDNTPD